MIAMTLIEGIAGGVCWLLVALGVGMVCGRAIHLGDQGVDEERRDVLDAWNRVGDTADRSWR